MQRTPQPSTCGNATPRAQMARCKAYASFAWAEVRKCKSSAPFARAMRATCGDATPRVQMAKVQAKTRRSYLQRGRPLGSAAGSFGFVSATRWTFDSLEMCGQGVSSCIVRARMFHRRILAFVYAVEVTRVTARIAWHVRLRRTVDLAREKSNEVREVWCTVVALPSLDSRLPIGPTKFPLVVPLPLLLRSCQAVRSEVYPVGRFLTPPPILSRSSNLGLESHKLTSQQQRWPRARCKVRHLWP